MEDNRKKSIDDIFREGTLIDKALKQGVQEALLRHKQLGQSVVVWQNDEIVWLKPEEIKIN